MHSKTSIGFIRQANSFACWSSNGF